MSGALGQIDKLEAEYERTQKNKATLKHLGAMVKKLRREVMDAAVVEVVQVQALM